MSDHASSPDHVYRSFEARLALKVSIITTSRATSIQLFGLRPTTLKHQPRRRITPVDAFIISEEKAAWPAASCALA